MIDICIIDTHAHYNSTSVNNLDKKIEEINNSKNIKRVINVGLDVKTSIEIVRIGNSNSKFYSAIGIHPLHEGDLKSIEVIYNGANNEKIVAIGETGIDTKKEAKGQIQKFINSILLANKLKLPIIIHSNTTKDSNVYANRLCIEILKTYRPEYGFVFHCFQPDTEILKEILKLNGFISVASMITKTNAKKSLEVLKEVPIENLLIETDYPFLAADESLSIMNTFNRVCEIKRTEKIRTMEKLNDNAKTLFYKLK